MAIEIVYDCYLELLMIYTYILNMKSHELIENRSLEIARRIVAKIDADPRHTGVEKARLVCKRWIEQGTCRSVREWESILKLPWLRIKAILLDTSEEGRRLRQSNPFCGILTPEERWNIYRRFSTRETV